MDNKKQGQGLSYTFRAAVYWKQALSAIPRPDYINVVIAVLSHTFLFIFSSAGVVARHLRLAFYFPDGDTNITVGHGVLFHAPSLFLFCCVLRNPSK